MTAGRGLAAGAVAFAVGLAPAAAQERAPANPPFCRFVEEGEGGHLDVLVATYGKGEATVTLHASIHFADPAHYRELQQRFAAFDALLYELIAESAERPHPGEPMPGDDPFSLLQDGMAKGLGLADQCEVLDYRAKNFVHADLTPDQLDAAFAAKGTTMFAELMRIRAVEPDRAAEARRRAIDLVAAHRGGRGKHELRVLHARMTAEEEEPPREPSVLIEGRNERCLEVLQRELAAGKKKLGVYYGAMHMAHLERRLVQDLGFRKTGEEWLVAWNCSPDRDPPVERGLQRKRYRARQDLDALREAVRAFREANRTDAVPTLEELRRARPEQKLPGRADGLDPWGNPYVLRASRGGEGFELRCTGSDGKVDTDDDVVASGEGKEETAFDPVTRILELQRGREGWQRLYEEEVARRKLARGENADARPAPAAADESERLTAMLAELEKDVAALRAAGSRSAEDARREKACAGARLVHDAARLYRARFGRTPTLAELVTKDEQGRSLLESATTDPWGGTYEIVDAPDGGISVRSRGPDGKPDTGDDVRSRLP